MIVLEAKCLINIIWVSRINRVKNASAICDKQADVEQNGRKSVSLVGAHGKNGLKMRLLSVINKQMSNRMDEKVCL